MIESNVSIKLESFKVPDMVNEEDRFKNRPAPCAVAHSQYPQQAPVPSNEWIAPTLYTRQFLLAEVPPETLLKMCEAFKTEVFKRAGKSDYLLTNAVAEG